MPSGLRGYSCAYPAVASRHGAKATLHIIKVMGGDTEVSQERIHLPQLFIVVHEALEMAEVRGDEREASVSSARAAACGILVEGVEMPAVGEAVEYST